MKILFVDGGNLTKRVDESYNIGAAQEAARLVQHLVGTQGNAFVVFDDSLDAERTASTICYLGVNSWQVTRLAKTYTPLRPWHDGLTMERVNELISFASANNRVVVFVVCVADSRIQAMLNLFKTLMNSKVEMPVRAPDDRASFNVYEVDTTNHLMQKFACK